MKHILRLLPFILFCAEAQAAPVPADFARGLIVDGGADSAIHEIVIPESVYLTATRPDLGDVRVYNAAGEIVPHAIRPAPVTPPAVEWIDVVFFPMFAEGALIDPEFGESGADGEVTILNERDGAVFVESADIPAYVVDLEMLGEMTEALTIELARAPDTYVKKVRLERSADLLEWEPLVSEATLVRLQRGQNVLLQNRIDLPRRVERYVRISWIEHDGSTQIVRVLAAMAPRTVAAREWRTLERLAGKDEAGTMRFDSGGPLPVDRVQLQFPEPNFALDVRVESRARENDPWRHRHAGMFYQLRVQDQLIETGPASVPVTADRYWRLRYGAEDDPALRGARLNVGWSAGKLLFLARGGGPYTVAFGSTGVDSPAQPTRALLDALERGAEGDLVATANIREEIVLSGDLALEERIRVDRRKLLLWGILVAGVILLAYMAVRLARQMYGAGGRSS